MNSNKQDNSQFGISARSLVFCSVGERIRILPWLEGLKDMDVGIVYYGGESPVAPPKSKYFLANKDFKIPNFIQLAKVHPDVLDYDYFFFVDDDLVFNADTLYTWQKIVIEYGLDVSQPSLTTNSKADWPHLIRQEGIKIDYDQFIEVQCFCLSKHALRFALPFFFMAKTGTGLDMAIYLLCKRHHLRSAVIHELSVLHPHRENEKTVRAQFVEFATFNPQFSRFISFCFDEQDILHNLALASRSFGDTSYRIVRLAGIVKFIYVRIKRKLYKILIRK